MASTSDNGTGVLPRFSFEKGRPEHHEDGKVTLPDLKLDKHGLPLVPQPSARQDDPLVRLYPFRLPEDSACSYSLSELVASAEACCAASSGFLVASGPYVFSGGQSCIRSSKCSIQDLDRSGILRAGRIRKYPRVASPERLSC